jgi:hypothetical protein
MRLISEGEIIPLGLSKTKDMFFPYYFIRIPLPLVWKDYDPCTNSFQWGYASIFLKFKGGIFHTPFNNRPDIL